MKNNHLIKFGAFLLVCCAMLGCTPEGKNPGSIYGTVTDKSTGDCVPIAGVELMPKGLKTVTGSDGTFQFTEIDPGQYNLFITKVGYQDFKSSDIIVKSGETAKGDVQIEKLPASLQIVDNQGNKITEVDFGSDDGVTSKTFNIFNGGTETLDFTITKTVDWIESVSQTTGTVNVGVTFPIIVKINRALLTNGLNSTTLLITSPSGGGVELTIKATLDYYSAFSVVNNNGDEITEIDFGSDENITQKTFMIRNDGNQSISYSITKTAPWITSISQATGSVNASATIPIILGINRNALSDGMNSTSLIITTPTAGGAELVIKATKTIFGGTCKIVFELYDSYGDGWGSAHLDFNDGASTHSLICSGSGSSYAFEYIVGTNISVSYTTGSYNNENSYKIRYEDGSLIYQCSNIPSGFQCSFIVDCNNPNPGGGGGGGNGNGTATIILTAGDVWGDGTGYQLLLDNTHSLYGTTIPETGALSTNCSGNESIYAKFSHKIPTNADGNCTTSHIVINNSVSITIPAGTYDWCITNPTPNDRIWIAASNGNVGGRQDNYEFEAGNTYVFVPSKYGEHDGVDVTITGGAKGKKSMGQSNAECRSARKR